MARFEQDGVLYGEKPEKILMRWRKLEQTLTQGRERREIRS
jgi:hypothetical protein